MIKSFSLADLERIYDEYKDKPKPVENRNNWTQEEGFHKYISYVTYENDKVVTLIEKPGKQLKRRKELFAYYNSLSDIFD